MPWCNATGNTHGLWNILAQKLTLNLIKLLDLTSWNGKKHGGHRNRSKQQVNMSSQTKDTGNFTNYLVSSINNSVQFSRSLVSDSLQPHEPQHTRPRCPSPSPGVHPNPCPLCWWCHPTISSSVVPFSSRLSIFPSIRVPSLPYCRPWGCKESTWLRDWTTTICFYFLNEIVFWKSLLLLFFNKCLVEFTSECFNTANVSILQNDHHKKSG